MTYLYKNLKLIFCVALTTVYAIIFVYRYFCSFGLGAEIHDFSAVFITIHVN